MKAASHSLHLLIAMGAIALPFCASAQVGSTLSNSTPSSHIAISFTTADYSHQAGNTTGFGWNGYTSQRRDLGQTFTVAAAFTLDKIVLPIQFINEGTPGASYSLSLYVFEDANSLTASSCMGTWTGTLPGSADLSQGAYHYDNGTTGPYLTFDIPDTALIAGKTYGFVLSFTNLTEKQSMNIWIKGGGYYKGGQQIQTDTTGSMTFTNTGNNDLLFYLQPATETNS